MLLLAGLFILLAHPHLKALACQRHCVTMAFLLKTELQDNVLQSFGRRLLQGVHEESESSIPCFLAVPCAQLLSLVLLVLLDHLLSSSTSSGMYLLPKS